jgi:DNA helicase HerA-like ATPase
MTFETALQKLIQEQLQWIRQLNGGHNCSLSWRLITSGNSEEELIFGLIGKTEGTQESEIILNARNFFNQVRDSFPNGYPLEFCQTIEQLNLLRLPFLPTETGQIGEFRRPVTTLESISSPDFPSAKGMMITPWKPNTSNFQELFRALINHPVPAGVAINLQSTQFTALETKEITRIADSYGRAASVNRTESNQFRSLNISQQGQQKLLEAEQASLTWSQFLQNGRNCWEMTVSIMSESPLPQSVIASLQSAIEGEKNTDNEERSRGVVVIARTESQKMAAFQNWVDLTRHRWANDEELGRDLNRLPLLFSTEEVHSLFRLPIADRFGVWGLPSAPSAKDARKSPKISPIAKEIQIGSLHLTKKQLTQHLLISGVPGSGKTNTSLFLLETLWREHRIPWLVLEPAKTEYRGLKTVPSLSEDLLIFSLGDERVAPFRFNPFELPEGINLDSHLGALLDLFAVSMSMWGPLPNVVEQLIQEAYKRKGFTLLGDNQELEPPCFSDLVNLIPEIVPKLGYKKETTDEITAAISVRLNKFCRGTLGQMLNVNQSLNFDLLMKVPVILEMSQITNSDDRAFIMGLILNRCYQYWIARREEATGELKHLLLVEEAHNLLGNIPESTNQEQANPKGKAVKNFANMLAEVRGFGQGMAIAEQNPQGLVPDVMVNTNIKIAHRIVEANNRESLANSMLLTPQQQKALASLKVGQFYYYIGGQQEPNLTVSPNFKDDIKNNFNPRLTDKEINLLTKNFRQNNAFVYEPLKGCPQEPELISCIEYGKNLVEIILDNPQYKELKINLFLQLVTTPFNENIITIIYPTLGRILVERGINHLTKEQIKAVINSAISFLALEAVKEKGKIHGWLGKQTKQGHQLLMTNILQPSLEAQSNWLILNSIPSHLLELNLLHPEYKNYPFPGVFRYESQILCQNAESFFNYLSQVSVTPAQALYDWLNQSIPFLFPILSIELQQSFHFCVALKITENRPDLLINFLP